MTFKEINELIIQMDIEKDWQDGQPGDLAKSILIECAELLEHFQWDDTLKHRGQENLNRDKIEIGKEMADILIYLIKLSNKMKIDLIDVTSKKISENRNNLK